MLQALFLAGKHRAGLKCGPKHRILKGRRRGAGGAAPAVTRM